MRGGRVLVGLAAVASVGACSMPYTDRAPVIVTVTPSPVTTPDSASTPSPSATAAPTKEALAMPFVSGSRNWTALAKRASPAVVRIEVAGCDTRVVGSGYFIAKDLIVTAGHVVSGASALSVQYAGGVVPALVVGIDRTSDVAMIRTARPVAPATLRLATRPAAQPTTSPTTGSGPQPKDLRRDPATTTPALADTPEVGILGYPSGTFNLQATEGAIVGTATVNYGTSKVENALETDAAITDGVTGGPAVDRAGHVVGIVTGSPLWISGLDQSIAAKQAKGKALNRSQGTTKGTSGGSTVDRTRMRSTGFVVPAREVADVVNRWRDSPNRDLLGCLGDAAPVVDDPFALTVDVLSGHSYARDVAAALALHGQAINAGTFEVAYEMLTPRLQKELESLDAWRTKEANTHWVRAEVRGMVGTGNVVEAKVALRTTQDGADGKAGQTCSVSEQSYTLRTSGGGWLIDRIRTLAPPTAC